MSNFTDFAGGSGGVLWWDDIYDNIQEFTTSGTFNTPADCTEVTIGICGGGGGHYEGSSGSHSGSAGGGGSGMTYHTFNVTPSSSYTVIIGAGGAGGNTSPSAGGNSSFGSFITVSGGQTGSLTMAGQGRNGGANGGIAGYDYDSSTSSKVGFLVEGGSITVSKAIKGCVVTKTIQPNGAVGYYGANSHKSSGGAGGGFDYENYGTGGSNYSGGDATDGICVVWY